MRAVALRYALAPACVLLAVLVHLSPAGSLVSLAGLFVFAVLAAAWFGGVGPGLLAAVLATFTLPQLIAVSYPLLGGVLDLPRFITFSIAALAVGWWSFRRRQVEVALRDQERYAHAMNASDDGFWDWVPAGDTVYASPRLLEIYGFAPGTKFDGRGDLLARIPFHPEDHAPLVRAIGDHFAGKTARFDIEARFIRDGETRWVHLTGMAARDASGAVVRWTGTVRDVTERKSAQDELRESEARFRALTELSADWYWRQDEDLRFTYVSHQVADTESYPRDWVTGKTRWELPGITPVSFTWDDHKAALNARRPFRDLEYAREGLNGRTEYVSISGAPIFDEQGDFRGYHGVGRNITERKRAEETLRNSEQRYALAMEAAGDGHTDWDLVSGEFYISPRLFHILGYSPATTFADRADWVRRFPFHPEDRPKWEAAVAAHLAGRDAKFRMDLRIVVGGETRWVAFTFIASRDPAGKPVRWTGSIADINDAKLAEEARRESEERYERVVAATEAGFWDWDVVQDKYYVSPRLLEMSELPPGTVIANRADFQSRVPLHPEDLEKWKQAIKALFESGGSRLSAELRAVFGAETRWYRLDGMCFRDAAGRVVRWTGSSIDITARKRIEEELRESEARFRSLTELSSDWYWQQDENLRFTYLSSQAQQLTGYSGESSLGKTRWEIANMTPLTCSWAEHQALLAARQPFRDLECRRLGPDGTVRYLSISGAPVFDAQGEFRGYRGIGRNITARMQAEQALRDSEARKSAMFETALDCIVSIDHEGRVVEFNPAAERTFGYRRAEALGKELAELIIPTRLRAQHRQGLARYLKSGEGRVLGKRTEMSAVRADGSEFPVELSVTRIATEGAPLFTAYLRDITRRKLAEEALRASEERYEIAMAASESGYWDWDIPSNRYFVSARANELAGFPPENTFAGRGDFRARIPMHPDDWVKWEAAREKLFAGTGERLAMEVRYIVRGETRWHSLQAICRRDDTGKVVRWTGSATDVTARKLAEEELRESEARFRVLTELSSDWYWRQDEQLRFVYMTNHATVLGGYTHDSSLGKTWWELEGLAPLSKSSWAEHQALLAARQPFRDLELRRVMPDGSINYLSIGGAPTFDEQGRFRGYQGVGRNITERKRIEEELRSRQEMLGLAQKSAQAIAFEWLIGASRADHTRWSPELAAMHGITPEAYDGSLRQWKKLIHPGDRPAVREAIRHAHHTGEVSAEYRVVHSDGSVHWLHARGRMFFDAEGKPARMVGFMHDVTQRRHAEEALRLSEERYALAVASADEGIFDWDLLSDRVYVSQRARELFALPVGELWHPRRDWRRILNYHPEDTKLQRDSIKALIAGDTSTYDVEFRVIFPDGSVRWFRQRAIALRDAAGKAYRMVGSVGDVTDRKRAQEELQRLERQLRQAQRLEAMGTLAGGIAHDFNNILGAILGYGEMAQRGAPKGSRLARDLDSIIVAGERGRALVDRVLAFSRSAVGERVPVHVEGVVREALDLVSAKLPANIKLQAMLRAGRSAIVGDATQVHQVLMNLATNAIQAMPGGGTLRVSLDVSRIDASHVPTIGILAPASEYLVLRVSDTGTGIAPDILERIFDPFFTTKEVGTGTGLGLSLVHGIVSDLGGAIDVASTAGTGSTFTVYLPRSGEADEAREDEEPEIPRGDGQRVLIVDDEEPLVRLATRTLEELGYAPVGFTSSTAALEAFRAAPERFDALITDERMPGMSGSVLIREVRGIRGGMPIVLMSGYVGGAVTRRARSAGAEEVLKKPLSARDLATSLARVLRL